MSYPILDDIGFSRYDASLLLLQFIFYLILGQQRYFHVVLVSFIVGVGITILMLLTQIICGYCMHFDSRTMFTPRQHYD
jgi:hypothetical protein